MNALRNWKARGYVNFKKHVQQWIQDELPECTADEIRHLLHQYVDCGGEVDEQKEHRPEYVDFEFHYDLRLTVGNRRLYFECVLICKYPDDPDDPIIEVVNVHDA